MNFGKPLYRLDFHRASHRISAASTRVHTANVMTLLVTLCSPRQISQIRASQAGIPTARRATVTQPAIPTLSHAASSLGKTLEMLVQRPDRYAPCAGDRCQRCFVAASPPVFLHPGPFLLDHKLQRQCNWPGRSGLLPSRRLAEDFVEGHYGASGPGCVEFPSRFPSSRTAWVNQRRQRISTSAAAFNEAGIAPQAVVVPSGVNPPRA